MRIVVDSREKEHVRKWLFKRGVRYDVEALPTGDYLFVGDDGKRVLVERKTVNDLIGSYRSGRLKDQFTRMSKEECPILLVTGTVEEVKKYVKVEPTFVQKVMSDAIVKFKFRGVIWMVTNEKDTNVHREGLIFMADMMKSMSMGNMDIVDSVNKKVTKRDINVKSIVDVKKGSAKRCKKCGKVKEMYNYKETKFWLCQTPGCGDSGDI